MLCNTCKALDFKLTVPGHSNRLFSVLHRNPESFRQSQDLGCRFCLLITSNLGPVNIRNGVCDHLGAFIALSCSINALQAHPKAHEKSLVAITIISRLGTAVLDVIDPIPDDYSFLYPTSSLASQNKATEDVTGRAAKRRRLDTSPSQQQPSSPEQLSTGSPENLKLAKLWLTQCKKHHPHCNVSQEKACLPTRLINVENPDKPFLELTNDQSEGPFLAFSHRWGKKQLLRTTTSNFDAHKQCLSVSELPKSFADAIYVTRSLNYKYLWIDSLCIIQDGPDKLHEIQKMDLIYQHAEFTIYAQGAEDSHAGFFQNRDPRRYRPCKLPISITAGNQSVKMKVTLATTCNGPDYLKSRGWILQEQVLSSRCLKFGKQMSWVCSMGEAQETHPVLRLRKTHAEGSSAWILDRLRSSLYGTESEIAGPRNPQKITSQFDLWYKMLEEYGDMELSDSSDIINAVTGLAQLFQKTHGAIFMKGLWREDLKFGLAWYVGFNERRPVSENSNEPSWSWASVGKVRIKSRSWRNTQGPLDGVGCEVVVKDDDSNSDTTITLRAPVQKAKLCYKASFSSARHQKCLGGPDTEFDGIDTREQPRYPALLLSEDTNQPVAEAALDREFHKIQDDLDSNQDNTSTSLMDVECVLLHAQSSFIGARGTILIVKSTGQENLYKRVGLGFVVGKHMSWFGITGTSQSRGSIKETAVKEIKIR